MIPRDATRPKLEELVAWYDEIPLLPFQPEEEEVLEKIVDNAHKFRDHVAGYCSPLLSTEAEVETQRFYLRKILGAELLLAFETNFFRQQLHKWCPVAPDPPDLMEESKSTRKPRPTKLQKMLMEYGVDDPDDLPENVKAKANSLKRKAQNAEAAAAAAQAQAQSSPVTSVAPGSDGYGSAIHPYFSGLPSADSIDGAHGLPRPSSESRRRGSSKGDAMEIDGSLSLHPGGVFIGDGAGGPRVLVGSSTLSLEERLLRGEEDGLNLHTPAGKQQALELLRRTEDGRRRAEEIFGSGIWSDNPGLLVTEDGMAPQEDQGEVDKMFTDLTNHGDVDGKKEYGGGEITADSLESEMNGMDALLDGD